MNRDETEVLLACLLSGMIVVAVLVWLVAAAVWVAVRTCGLLGPCSR